MYGQPKYSNERLFRYPHMFPLDIAIWERFIDTHGNEFLGFDYDVKVGSGTKPDKRVPDAYYRMQRILSKYRIDCVGYKRDAIYIIEVKPEAGTIAIGQIETYTRLFKRDIKPDLPIIGCIVTDRILPDMEYLTEAKDIAYYIV
jgi:hypothetical protein